MKRILIFPLLLLTFYLSLFTSPISAHLLGQPPFFKINGQYSGLYHVPISSTQFDIPQDNSPKTVLIGEKIDFEIDTQAMQIPPDVVVSSKFMWKFGDGSTGSGLKSSHTYQKAGSHILTIDVSYAQVPEATLLQSVVINVLPDKNYQLPTVKIKVNNQEPKDPIVDIVQLKYDQQVNFQAEAKASEGATISSYQWDFNDSETANTANVSHAYKNDQDRSEFFPIVRVEDSNGFCADAYVQLSADPNYISQVKKTNNKAKYVFFTLVAVFILAMGMLFVKDSKKKK